MSVDDKCKECGKNPSSRNNWFTECTVVNCPHRRTCWSERVPTLGKRPDYVCTVCLKTDHRAPNCPDAERMREL